MPAKNGFVLPWFISHGAMGTQEGAGQTHSLLSNEKDRLSAKPTMRPRESLTEQLGESWEPRVGQLTSPRGQGRLQQEVAPET